MPSAAHAAPFPHLSPVPDFDTPAQPQSVLATRAVGRRIQPTSVGALGRLALATLITGLHLGGLAALAYLSQDPVIPPEVVPIQVSLIAGDPLPKPAAETPPAPAPAPEPVPAPEVLPVEPPPEPPKPVVREPEPPPPVVKKPPPPKPVVKRPPPQTVTESPTALSAPEEAPPAPPAPAQAAVTESQAPPPAPAAAPAAASAAAAPVTAARFDAAYLNNPPPAYPMASRRLREEGQVTLRVLVQPDGKASQVEIRTSSGSDRLDRAAREQVARWTFEPARQGGRKIESWVLVPVVFKLKGN